MCERALLETHAPPAANYQFRLKFFFMLTYRSHGPIFKWSPTAYIMCRLSQVHSYGFFSTVSAQASPPTVTLTGVSAPCMPAIAMAPICTVLAPFGSSDS